MNCDEALTLISAELDGELTPQEAAALQEHLRTCPDCRVLRQELREQDALLREAELEPPQALHDGVMKAIRQETRTAKRHFWLPAAAIAAVAALVLLAGKAGLLPLPGFTQNTALTADIGTAADRLWQTPKKQAAALASESGLDVLLLEDSEVPKELESMQYEETEDGARLYRVSGALCKIMMETYRSTLYAAAPEDAELSEKETACILLYP